MNRRLLIRWLKFNGVGFVGVLVQTGVLASLGALGVGYLTATMAAVEAAILHNFLWHEHWTWRDRGRAQPEQWVSRLLRFHLANGLISLVGNAALMWWLVGVLGGPLVLSNLVAIAVCGGVNFVAGDWYVFSSRGRRWTATPGGGAS